MSKPKKALNHDDVIEQVPAETLIHVINTLTDGLLDRTKLGLRIHRAKKQIENAKDPNWEAWMDQR